MEERAQGALEYLLLIGGAILVAAIVIGIMGGMLSNPETTVHGKLDHFLTHDI